MAKIFMKLLLLTSSIDCKFRMGHKSVKHYGNCGEKFIFLKANRSNMRKLRAEIYLKAIDRLSIEGGMIRKR